MSSQVRQDEEADTQDNGAPTQQDSVNGGQTEAPECCHHWDIETADGPISTGVCRKCLETREFKNSIDTEWYYDSGKSKTLDPVPLE